MTKRAQSITAGNTPGNTHGMTPTLVGRTMKCARHLLRAGALTPHDFVVLDCLAFACRAPGQIKLSVAYRRMADLAGVSVGSAVRAVKRLIGVGLLAKHKRTRLVRWHQGGMARRQVTNLYALVPLDVARSSPAGFHCGSTPRPAYQELEKQEGLQGLVGPALVEQRVLLGLDPGQAVADSPKGTGKLGVGGFQHADPPLMSGLAVHAGA